MVPLLLEHKADPNARANAGFTPLHDAARYGLHVHVSALLQHGADVNALVTSNKRTPLFYATGYGQLECVRELLRAGADPASVDSKGLTPSDLARQYGQHAILAALEGEAESEAAGEVAGEAEDEDGEAEDQGDGGQPRASCGEGVAAAAGESIDEVGYGASASGFGSSAPTLKRPHRQPPSGAPATKPKLR